jgi:phage terminase large subunit-like protein
MEHVRLGLRVGPNPHMLGTSTPRTRPEVRELLEADRTIVTRGRTRDAHHLDDLTVQALLEQYAGTTIGRQELEGELLDNVEGALWKRWLIERNRIRPGLQPELRRVVVSVDPNAGGPDEAGITVQGVGRDLAPDRSGHVVSHGYVLADYSDHYASSEGWARAAVQAYHTWKADSIVAETNNGGDMVGLTVRTIDPTVRYRAVTATRGKARRAEPVVALYEQDRWHHVGAFPKLEDQMTTWTEDVGDDWSPDRMDSLVWGATDLALAGPRGFAGAA